MELLQPITSSTLQSFVDNRDRLMTQPLELQIAVANYPETPRHLLEVLVNSPDPQVAEAAQLHVNWAGEMINLPSVVDEMLRDRQLGQNDRLAVELLKIAPVPEYFLSQWVPTDKLIQGLRNPYMPLRYRLKLLERLAKEPTLEPRLQVAESPETPLAVLEQLAGDLELIIRLAVKFNPSCPPQLIELVEGQHAIASDWHTDTEQLTMLAQSRWAWIRLAVAQNPSTPATTLMQLATDEILKIQLAVAKNPGTPVEVLAVLASETATQVAVAEHPNTTEEILHQLFPTHQHIVRDRENLPVSILERFYSEADKPVWRNYKLLYLLIAQANTPTWVLAQLADVDLEVLRAEKLTSNSDIVDIIEQSTEEWVQDKIRFLVHVAKHPQVSVEVLERLSQYPYPWLQWAVVQNQKTPVQLQMQLLETLVGIADERVLKDVAANPNTPVSILEKIADKEHYQNKFRVKLRQLLTRKPHEDNSESDDDFWMDSVHEILEQNQITLNVEQWFTLLESYQWMTRLEDYTYFGKLLERFGRDKSFRESVVEQWSELLPTLPQKTLQQIISNVLRISDTLSQVVKSDRTIAIALAGNPNTPASFREQLQHQLTHSPDDWDTQMNNTELRLALAYNWAIPEAERIEYLHQILSSCGDMMREHIAKNPNTPLSILEQIAERGAVYAVAHNPHAPVSILRQAAQQDNSYTLESVAKNPNTPIDLLKELILKTGKDEIREAALRNPNLDRFTAYQIQLELQDREETARTTQELAKRPDSPYALAQVLEKGDRNAKLTAARSHKTPIQILEQLAKDANEIVRQVVLQNSNLPLNSLLELTQDKSVNIRLSLAYRSSRQTIPPQVIERLAQDESEQVRAGVAAHSDTPVELLVRLADDPSREVKNKLTANPKTPATVLMRLGLEHNLVNQRNPNTPGEVLAQAVNRILSNSHQNEDRWSGLESTNKPLVELLKHPPKGSQMPASTLQRLAAHHYPSVRYRVAQHPNTPTSALEQLASDSYEPTLRALVDNPNTPPYILEQLANTPDLTTRLSIARNPNTPAQVLAQIVLSTQNSGNQPHRTVDALKSAFPGSHNDLLQTIASNLRTPIEALEIIARREFVGATLDPQSILPPTTNDDVVRSLAYNPSLTPQLLQILVQDPCVEVRSLLTRHPNLTPALWMQLARDEALAVREAVAANKEAPEQVLQLLARDEQAEVRVKVANNPNTAIAILSSLAVDESSAVRAAVASHPSLPTAQLESLAQDDKVEVRRAVAQNPHTPASIRDTLKDLILQPQTKQISSTLRGLPRLYNPQTDDLAIVLAEYARSPNAFVRFVTLLHPLTPEAVLEQGAQSVSWLERYAVADNPATAVKLRSSLAQDSNRIVRATAKANLLT